MFKSPLSNEAHWLILSYSSSGFPKQLLVLPGVARGMTKSYLRRSLIIKSIVRFFDENEYAGISAEFWLLKKMILQFVFMLLKCFPFIVSSLFL